MTIEILKGDILRFTQVDRDGRTNVVTFSDRLAARLGVFDAAPVGTERFGANA